MVLLASRACLPASALTRPRLRPRSRRLLAAFGDDRLVAEVRLGNEAACEAIYDRYHRELLSFCRHMLGSLDDAEEALQHTFLSAFRALAGDARSIALRPWLYQIARNRCLSMLRSPRERPVEEVEQSSTAGLSEEVEQRAELRELIADVGQLPERQRAALVLSEVGDLSHSEVAKVLGCERNQVKALVFQARQKLIDGQQAREVPCVEIREELASVKGGALRRGTIRRHLKTCDGCREFRDQVRRQRAMLGVALPVAPSLGLKESALAAAGIGAGGGGAAGGGGLIAVLGAHGAAKAAAVVVATGGAIGGMAVADPQLLERAEAVIERGAAAIDRGVAAITTAPESARPLGGGRLGDGRADGEFSWSDAKAAARREARRRAESRPAGAAPSGAPSPSRGRGRGGNPGAAAGGHGGSSNGRGMARGHDRGNSGRAGAGQAQGHARGGNGASGGSGGRGALGAPRIGRGVDRGRGPVRSLPRPRDLIPKRSGASARALGQAR